MTAWLRGGRLGEAGHPGGTGLIVAGVTAACNGQAPANKTFRSLIGGVRVGTILPDIPLAPADRGQGGELYRSAAFPLRK